MPILIWRACILIAWAASSGPVAGYVVEVGDQEPFEVPFAEADICIPEKYETTEVRVAGFDIDGELGEWSDPLTITLVHNFDADRSGTIGVSDWALFQKQGIATRYLESGVVEVWE